MSLRVKLPNQSRPHERPRTLRAQQLRREMTDGERILWSELRYDKLGFRFKRQVPMSTYILDFYCPAALLAIEVDGEIHDPAVDAIRDEKVSGVRCEDASNSQPRALQPGSAPSLARSDLPRMCESVGDRPVPGATLNLSPSPSPPPRDLPTSQARRAQERGTGIRTPVSCPGGEVARVPYSATPERCGWRGRTRGRTLRLERGGRSSSTGCRPSDR
ncbi:MAG: DUF559 domain-containing protein [Fimbriimonadaceae bacterium]|nr:DUF559 domain-containing protein [Fimbriimonadaceae bacterium]